MVSPRAISTPPHETTPAIQIPPLRNGDRLTRPEFERRYHAMPENIKAELLEGIVYMASPVRFGYHGGQDADLNTWLGIYRYATPGIRASINTTVRLDLDNEPQPDGLLFIEPARGGQVRVDEEGYIVGGPELAAEVAASSVSFDLHVKLAVYQRNAVREYLVWRVEDNAFDWFVSRDGNYVPLPPAADGILKSEVFPGLWLDAAALLRGDVVTVQRVLQQGLATPEHAGFVARLAAQPTAFKP